VDQTGWNERQITEFQLYKNSVEKHQRQRERITYDVFMSYMERQLAMKESCMSIPFTCCMWLIFMLIMTLHASVAYSYMTREGAVVDIERT